MRRPCPTCSWLPPAILAALDRRRRLGGHSGVAARLSSASTNSCICLMLNPIALLLTGYMSARVLKAPGPTNKLPDIVDAARLTNFTLYSQLNTGIFIALACCVLVAVFNVGDGARLRMEADRPESALRQLRRRAHPRQRDRRHAGERRDRRASPARSRCSASTAPSTTISRRATASTASPWRCSPIRTRSACILSSFLFGALNSGSLGAADAARRLANISSRCFSSWSC